MLKTYRGRDTSGSWAGRIVRADQFIAAQKPWPAGVRETNRLCPCPQCNDKKPHNAWEFVVPNHKDYLIFVDDGTVIIYEDDPKMVSTPWPPSVFHAAFEETADA